MALMLTGKSAVRAARMGIILAISMTIGAGRANGEGRRNPRHGQDYHGSTTVSVATLQVPEKAWKHFEKARVLALKHNMVESERESGKALAIAPSFAAAHILQASQQLLLKEYQAAIASVMAARKSDPDVEWAGVVLAGAYNGLHRYDDALTTIDDLQSAEADSWQAKYEQARAQIGMGDEERALKLTEDVMALAPKNFLDAGLVRANALILAHRWAEANECLSVYLARRGPQPRRDQVLAALSNVKVHMKAEQPVSLASR